jgi:hypothetical protein
MKKNLLTISLLLASVFAKSQNLISHYDFDNTSFSGGSYGGNLVQSGTGTAFSFVTPSAANNANDSCVQFLNGQGLESSGPVYNVGWTATAISVWYNSTSTYSGYIVQGAYLGFGLYIVPSGVVNVFFDGTYSGAYGSVVSVNDGNWHHIVAQNNSSTTDIYIDGVLTRTGAETLYTMPVQNSNAKLIFGNSANNISGDKIYGKLDEFKLFSDMLTQTEITTLYQYGNNPTAISENTLSKNNVVIYPNPTKDNVTINSIGLLNKISIYSINGLLIKTINEPTNTFDISDLSVGMYIIEVQTNKGISQTKVIKD